MHTMSIILLIIEWSYYYYQWHRKTVPDPCDSASCDINADCEREGLLSANFTCSCRYPFTDGDGFNCSSKIRL